MTLLTYDLKLSPGCPSKKMSLTRDESNVVPNNVSITIFNTNLKNRFYA